MYFLTPSGFSNIVFTYILRKSLDEKKILFIYHRVSAARIGFDSVTAKIPLQLIMFLRR